LSLVINNQARQNQSDDFIFGNLAVVTPQGGILDLGFASPSFNGFAISDIDV